MTLNMRRPLYRAKLNNRGRYTHCVIAPRCPAMFLPIGIRKTNTSQSLPASSVVDAERYFQSMRCVRSCSYALVPHHQAHFARYGPGAIVQVHGIGPLTINYIEK